MSEKTPAIKLPKEQLELFENLGRHIHIGDDHYLNFPFWLKKTDDKEFLELIPLDNTPEELAKVNVEFFQRKTTWTFDCWDRSGKVRSIVIEALNAENAEIIFREKNPNWSFDPPY